VYGEVFSTGVSAVASAESFKNTHAAMFGADPADLVAETGLYAGGNTQPLMYNRETGTYKFTAVYYNQQRDNVPVYGTRLIVLTRNEPGYPAVLANPDLRMLGNFRVTPDQAVAAMPNAALQAIAGRFPGAQVDVHSSQRVIWAGTFDSDVDPVLADNTVVFVNGYDEWRLITNAKTGEILFDEHLICFGAPVSGTARGMATEGIGSEQCENEVPQVLKYLRVTSGANSAVTDANGDYTIDPDGGTINAVLDGTYFDVVHFTGTNTSVSIPVGSPADLLFNSANTDPTVRAQVNTYVESNRVRDYALQYNPAYPFVAAQTNFPARANRVDNFCPGNAWYSSTEQSINFCLVGPSNPNTSWSSVVHHEYGHRIVNAAGSGQGAYGEGTGDCMSVLILDDNRVGLGFFNSCATWLRDANNNCDYTTTGCSSCGSAIHTCGQLISGCLWETRNELLLTNPLTYRDIISDLAINAILMHGGTTNTSITPQITIDYLTLDDDVPPISNGTPHYNEINLGFTEHNMAAPPLTLLAFSFPNGQPAYVNPDGTSGVDVNVNNLAGTAIPGSGVLFADTGSGFQQYPMNELAPNQYVATIPASPCGTAVKYYFRATATGGTFQYSPTTAPAAFYTATSAFGAITAISDNFETNLGWTVLDQPTGTFTGTWQRGIPVTPPPSGCPPTDADGSSRCYVTLNLTGNNDVDNGSTLLTSPTIDASQTGMTLKFSRWYSNANNAAQDPFVVQFSIDDGANWLPLESTSGAQNGGWVARSFNLDLVPGFAPTSQFRVRFTAADLGTQAVIEAGVDGVIVEKLTCTDFCPADVAGGDGVVNITDLLFVIANWGGGAGNPADINGDSTVDIADLLSVIAAWGNC
jgi:hypothetical protein